MPSKKYEEVSLNLIKAAKIAIESLKKFPQKNETKNFNDHILKCYIEFEFDISNPEPKYRNLKSLKYLEDDVFTLFQEGSGELVEDFWKQIKEAGLPYKRENRLAKILKRHKIKNDIEYDFVTDAIVPYQQEGIITEEEEILLKKYLGDFEMKRKN